MEAALSNLGRGEDMKLILLDLDNTLIDSGYNLNVPENKFRSLVQELADRNVCVGLCSDSAVITLRQWADRLGLTGPIIAERGAVVWDPALGTADIIDAPGTKWFSDFRAEFVRTIMSNFPEATIMIGDATRFIKDRNASTTLAQQVFAVNGFRVASFSFFACRPQKNQSGLEPDAELLEKAGAFATKLLVEFGKSKEDLFWDENPQCGILIMHASTTEKWHGVSIMANRMVAEQTIMVGDSMSDFLNLPNVIQHAVGNADSRYKQKSSFVAKGVLTEGVIECLGQCM